MASNNAPDSYRFRPGLLDFGLNASSIEGNYQLSHNINIMVKLYKEYEHLPATACAILNMKGALYYFQHKYLEAKRCFIDVLKMDESNINAFTNLQLLNNQLGMPQRCSKPIQMTSRIKATCEGEQAFAIMFDCYTESDEFKRFSRSAALFESCLKSWRETTEQSDAQPPVDMETEMQWQLWYAELLQRLMNRCTGKAREEKRSFCIEKGIDTLNNVIDNSEQPHLVAMANTYKAIFLSRQPHPGNGDAKAERDTQVENLFEEALKVQENTETLVRYALFLSYKSDGDSLHRVTEKLDKAIEKLDRNIELDSSDGNWFAFVIRAKINLERFESFSKMVNKYMYDKTAVTTKAHATTSGEGCREGSFPISDTALAEPLQGPGSTSVTDSDKLETSQEKRPDNTAVTESRHSVSHEELLMLLNQSISDGIKATSLNPTVEAFSVLGQAYHRKALLLKEQADGNNEEVFFEALSSFLHALNHLDGKKVPYVHVRHGDCLRDMAQFRPAVESFKRALQCYKVHSPQGNQKSTAGKAATETYEKLMQCFMDLLLEEGNECLPEVIHWCHNESIDETERKKILGRLLDYNYDAVARIFRELFDTKLPDTKDILLDIFLASENVKAHPKIVFEVLKWVLPQHRRRRDMLQSCLDCLSKCAVEGFCTDDLVEEFSQILITVRKESSQVANVDQQFLAVICQLYSACPVLVINTTKQLLSQANGCHLAHVILHHCLADDFSCSVDDQHRLVMWQLWYEEMIGRNTLIALSESEDVFTSEILLQLEQDCPTEKARRSVSMLQRYLSQLDERAAPSSQVSETETSSSGGPSDPKTRASKYDYDFYVLHSEFKEDTEWVLYELVPTLEKRYNFKGCLEVRDFKPGHSILKENSESLRKSYKIIVVISDAFKDSDKCMYFLHQAIHGKLGQANLIPLQRDGCKIPEEMGMIVPLSAVNGFDWEKLVKALQNGMC